MCRRKMLLEYFGEAVPSDRCGNCDACDKPAGEQIDAAASVRLLLGVIAERGERYGAVFPIKVLLGSSAADVLDKKGNQSSFYGRGHHFSLKWWQELLQQLRLLGYTLDVLRDRYTLVALSDKGRAWLNAGDAAPPLKVPASAALLRECGLDGKPTSLSSKPAAARAAHGVDTFSAVRDGGGSQAGVKRKASGAEAPTSLHIFTPLDAHVSELFGMLLGVRARVARARNAPPYAVWSETALRSVAQTRPATVAVLATLDGWAAQSSSTDELQSVIDCVRTFCLKHGNLPMTEGAAATAPIAATAAEAAVAPEQSAKKAKSDAAAIAHDDIVDEALEREFNAYLRFFRTTRAQARVGAALSMSEDDAEQ